MEKAWGTLTPLASACSARNFQELIICSTRPCLACVPLATLLTTLGLSLLNKASESRNFRPQIKTISVYSNLENPSIDILFYSS